MEETSESESQNRQQDDDSKFEAFQMVVNGKRGQSVLQRGFAALWEIRTELAVQLVNRCHLNILSHSRIQTVWKIGSVIDG